MKAHTGRPKQETPSWGGDLWGGLAAMLVALPSSVAFGILVYSPLGPQYIGQGALAGILGAAALGLVAPLFGRTGGLISAPCAPAAAVLSAMVVELLAGNAGNGFEPASIPTLLALTALLSAGFQILYGAIGGGKLIKFIPYPVVSGYMSGVGVIIALGQFPKLLGLPKETALFTGLTSPELWKWQGLVVGIVTMVVMGVAPRITRKVPAAILGLLAGVLTYFGLAQYASELLVLEGNPLIIGSIQTSGSFLDAVAGRASSLLTFDPASIRHIFIPALTLSVLLSIDSLKTCVVLDALTRSRHNSNRELIGQGIGNFAACLAGGMPGAGTMGPTLVNVTSGGRTPRSGIMEGVCVVMTLLLLGQFIAWLPIGALAGILLVIAWRMIDKSMLRMLRYPSGRLDFAVIAAVITVAVTIDLIAASGVGVVLAIILFIRDQVRGSVIRQKRHMNQVSSKTHRRTAEREYLDQHGELGVFCELQGNLFFGTTDQLFSQLEANLRTARFILFDMRRVQSMDFSAAHLLEQMQAQLAERGGRLLFSGMPSAVLDRRDFEHDLKRVGALREDGGAVVSETLDGALEWIEERLLEDAGRRVTSEEEEWLEVKDMELFHGFDESVLGKLADCLDELSVSPGQKVFSLGDDGDEMFLVRRGSIQVLLPLEGGKYHHVATLGPGNFFGELTFLDRGLRSADALAKIPTDLYVLSRARFDAQAQSSGAAFDTQIFIRLALAIAERLRQADAELRALEER
jgi:sulfate permease, SulP family